MYGHRYTEEERKFFMEFIPGHTYKEIQKAFTDKFEWEISISQIKGYMANHKINSGTKGHFKKGHIPVNKGCKGVCAAGCEKGWFKKGNVSKNRRSVGSERISKDGYIEIKVSEPDKWKLKHRVIWEKANGPIHKNQIIIFVDGDKTNVAIENLRMISRSTHAVMNHTGLCAYDAELKDTAIAIADLKIKTSAVKKKARDIS